MKLREIIQHAKGQMLNPTVDVDEYDIVGGCGSDLMSDVLAAVQPGAVLLTGLCNLQVVRTAQMADVRAIVFLRGKQPSDEIVALATQENIPLILSQMGMFELCGRLYKAGLHSFETNWNGVDE